MTRQERRIHGLIEKAIVEHGYTLRTLKDGRGWIDHEQRTCCAVGAIALACGIEEMTLPRYIARTVGVSEKALWALHDDFELNAPGTLGADIRARYVEHQP